MIRDLFDREASYLWSRLARVAGSRAALASLWARDGDPRVTRIVQSAAYAFARVQEKLEDDVPEVAHALAATAFPEALRPTPSATIVQWQDARRAMRDVTTHATRLLESRAVDDVPCAFRTSWPVTCAPIHLTQGEIRTRESGVQVLRLRLEPYAESLAASVPEVLRVFVATQDPVHAIDLVRAACATREPVQVRGADVRNMEVSVREVATAPRWTALDGPLSLTLGPADRFASSTGLRALHAFPEVFAFFDLSGLRAAIAGMPAHTRALDVTIRLDGTVSERARDAIFHLGCAPAVNVFEARSVPLPARLGPCGTLRVPGPAGREVFDVGAAGILAEASPDQVLVVRSWESYRGGPYDDEELYLRLDRRPAVGRGPTELRAALVRPNGAASVPRGFLSADLLATDGARTESLSKGDLREEGDLRQITNITRVNAPHPAPLGQQLPWRLLAYGRMPVERFAQAGALAAFLDLHRTRARSDQGRGADPAQAGVLSSSRTSVKRVESGEVFSGDQVDFALDEGVFGGPGVTWLVGELVARALAERADFLRYTRARLVEREGGVRADYGVRAGGRLPPPFG